MAERHEREMERILGDSRILEENRRLMGQFDEEKTINGMASGTRWQ
ncbi:MAG: hypothetical protein ABIG39_04435 [Candidatus Micrarchaeota archaeon]